MRFLYSLLFYLALPFLLLRLCFRSLKEPAYRKRLTERLGYYPITLEKSIWIHAVSVGETIAALPLIKTLKSHFPDMPFVVTTMTPTGASQVKKALGDGILHLYLPYDLPNAVNRFLNTTKPMIGILMETELWPNLLAGCHQRHIPICLINARLSEKSAKGYRKVAALTQEMLKNLHVIGSQGQEDAKRFTALGAAKDRVVVTGNIKFDLELPDDLLSKGNHLRDQLGKDRFIWIAASTHQGEDEIILKAHEILRKKYPKALLIIVPRHPNRFDAIAAYCEQSFATVRRSQSLPCDSKTAIYVGDTMGELLLLYAASDIAFVGGSLIPHGGHNILEPGALKKPILAGPFLFNFAEISNLFISANALINVTNADSLADQLSYFLKHEDERLAMGNRALKVIMNNRGALAKQLQLIEQTLQFHN